MSFDTQGYSVDPKVVTEIEDIETEIGELEAELKKIEDKVVSSTPIITPISSYVRGKAQRDSLITRKPGVFISHNWRDKEFARKIAADLEKAGAQVWIDEAEIAIGESLIEKIRDGIDEMDYLAVILSPNSVKSEWVKREIDVAMNQEIEGRKVKVLPLLLRQCELPGFLKGKLYADFTSSNKYRNSFQKLLTSLGLVESLEKIDGQEKRFHDLALDRLYGKSSAATKLAILTKENSQYSSLSRLELANYEFARQREHRSLSIINSLSQLPTQDVFVQRAFSLLSGVCYVARQDYEIANNIIQKAPGRLKLTTRQQAFLALHEGIVALALNQPAYAEEAWKHLSGEIDEKLKNEPEYPFINVTRIFDRALVDVLLGTDPIEEIVENLPLAKYRGIAHFSAANSRVMRKCTKVTEVLQEWGKASGWERVPSLTFMWDRLRKYEILVLSNSGTLFPPKASINDAG